MKSGIVTYGFKVSIRIFHNIFNKPDNTPLQLVSLQWLTVLFNNCTML